MKKLLMVTDLSARSDRALERAVMLTQAHGAHLTVVHVIDGSLSESIEESQKTAAKEAIREHISALTADDGSGISADVVFCDESHDVLDMADRTEAEIIVLGAHRKDTFKYLFRKTEAEHMIRDGHVPVLLVKDRPKGPYNRVLVGVNFSTAATHAVEFAVKFAPAGAFYLVHAYDVPFRGFLFGDDAQEENREHHQAEFQRKINEEMAPLFAGGGENAPTFELIMQEGEVREAIHQQIEALKPDLLVVGTHTRKGVSRAVRGSVAEDLLKSPPCDVLAVKGE